MWLARMISSGTMKKTQRRSKNGSPNHGHFSSSSSSSTSASVTDYDVVCEGLRRIWAGYGSYKRVAAMVWPSQRDGFLALRARVVREERTCFWEAVALAVRADRALFAAVRDWFEAGPQCDVGVSPEGAGELLRKFPGPIAVYYWDSVDGTVTQLNGQAGGNGVLFVSETDKGTVRPHWLPVAGLGRGVRRPIRTVPVGPQVPSESTEDMDEPSDVQSSCSAQTCTEPVCPTVESVSPAVGVEDEDWEMVEAVTLPPRVRYLYTHSVSPPFEGTAYQAGPTKALRPTEVLAAWQHGFVQRLLGDKALETRPEILDGATVDERTILFHRLSGTNPLDVRLNMDGAIHLACITALACDGVTYVPGRICVLDDGESMWYYCRLVRQARPWPCWPCIPFYHVHKVRRVCLSEVEKSLGALDDFPSRAAQVRAQYALIKVQGCVPEDLIGPLNDVRMEHLAEPDFKRSGFEVAGSMLQMRETVAKLGKAQLGFGNP